MRNKIVSLLMITMMVFTFTAQNMTYGYGLGDSSLSVSVFCGGSEISELTLPQNERRAVEAKCSAAGEYEYRWQILADIQSDLWVDIYGQNKSETELSYAMLSALLDDAGSAYIRCKVTSDETEACSEPVCVTVARIPNLPAALPSESFNVLSTKHSAMRATMSSALLANEDIGIAPRAEFVYITINYLDADSRESIYGSYVTQLEKGSNFDQLVMSPTFLGFEPYYNPSDFATSDPETATEDADELRLQYTAIQNNVNVNVYYKPIDVAYTVHYFFQNINDDFYSERADLYYRGFAKTGTIIKDDELWAHAGETEGFSPLYHYPESVAADGSTSFECYYDRNYYLFKFDMDGGYGTEPIYARYDTAFVVNDPVKHGWTFEGWDELTVDSDNDGILDTGDGFRDIMPNNMPAENRSYRALWSRGNSRVTYVYWKENPNDDKYSYWASYAATVGPDTDTLTADDAPTAASQELEDYEYFTYDAKNPQNHTEVDVKGDGSTQVNVYYKRNEYTIRFYYTAEIDGQKMILAGQGGFKNNGANYKTDWQTTITPDADDWAAFIKDAEVEVDTNGNKYYYFPLTAKYEANISLSWPTTGKNPSNPNMKPETIYDPGTNNNKEETYEFVNWIVDPDSTYRLEVQNRSYVPGVQSKFTKEFIDHKDGEFASAITMLMGTPHYRYTFSYYFQELDGQTALRGSVSIGALDNKAPEQPASAFEGFDYPPTTTIDGDLISYHYVRAKFPVSIDNNGYIDDGFAAQYFEASLDYFANYSETTDEDGNPVVTITELDGTLHVLKYPDNLEKGAYEFDGFHTTENFAEGTEVTAAMTMPAENIKLYAHWIPVKHNIKFFKTYQDMIEYQQTGNADLLFTEAVVPHGNVVGSIATPEPPTEGDTSFSFGGWFYMNNGKKTAFTPLDIPIIRDSYVFADWGSRTTQPFIIRYAEKGTGKPVADATSGYGYQGATRTFYPKAGDPYNQLYPEYNKGYFPTVGSHSMVLKYEEDKTAPANNVHTFEYVKVGEVDYTVRYVDAKTLEDIEAPEPKKTSNAVVTERFKVISGYLPDAFYKRLILSVEWDEDSGTWVGTEKNEIIFYYTENTKSSYYAVHYWMQRPNTDGMQLSDYVESEAYTEGIADVGGSVSVTPQTFAGYALIEPPVDKEPDSYYEYYTDPEDTTTYIKRDAVLNGKGGYDIPIYASGTELHLYYRLESFNYTINYLDYKTGQPIAASVVKRADYGTVVTEEAIDIEGYHPATEPHTVSVVIRANDSANEINFYYIKTDRVTVQYKVWPEGGGTLSLSVETVMLDGTAQFTGALPTVEPGYRFAGWYLDKECTKQVPTEMGSIAQGNRLIPRIGMLESVPHSTVFYAKFVESDGLTLTIQRASTDDESRGAQVFVYRVTNVLTREMFEVTVQGANAAVICNMQDGEYLVEQLNGWSWRYADEAQKVNLSDEEDAVVTFGKPASSSEQPDGTTDAHQRWLSANSPLKANKKGGTAK